jgi:hypothetical protein
MEPQMLDERRLLLKLNNKGVVTSASASPAALFGFEPSSTVHVGSTFASGNTSAELQSGFPCVLE